MRIDTRRLGPGDETVADALFALMSQVFEEARRPLGPAYLEGQLATSGLWIIAAFSQDALLGGLVAHRLPMTRGESAEAFLYDIAVDPAHQRMGVGRALVATLRETCATEGVGVMFVPADNDDAHALDFYRAIGGKPIAVTLFTFGEDG